MELDEVRNRLQAAKDMVRPDGVIGAALADLEMMVAEVEVPRNSREQLLMRVAANEGTIERLRASRDEIQAAIAASGVA
jgi:hypothetical protein